LPLHGIPRNRFEKLLSIRKSEPDQFDSWILQSCGRLPAHIFGLLR
jgi:hypothetical protein